MLAEELQPPALSLPFEVRHSSDMNDEPGGEIEDCKYELWYVQVKIVKIPTHVQSRGNKLELVQLTKNKTIYDHHHACICKVLGHNMLILEF